jgi:hypothetical protein
MQGSIIPWCCASVQVVPLPADCRIPEATVYGLILEDVGGVDITQFDPTSGDYALPVRALMAAVYTFPTYSVIHRNVQEPNILLRSPARAALLDLGQALLRQAGMSDEEWAEEVEAVDDINRLRYILNGRRIRDKTPFDSRGREDSDSRSRFQQRCSPISGRLE